MSNAFAQKPTAVQYSAATSVNKTFANPCANPSLFIASITSESLTETFTVSDDASNSWGNDIVATSGVTAGRSCVASAQNTSTSTVKVTCALGISSYGFFQIYEVTGAATSSALDKTGSQGDANAPSVTLSSCAANDTIVAAYTVYPNPGSLNDVGYTLDYGPTSGFFAYSMGESIADAGASGNKTLTFGGAGAPTYQALAIAAYKTAGGGGASSVPQIVNSFRHRTL